MFAKTSVRLTVAACARRYGPLFAALVISSLLGAALPPRALAQKSDKPQRKLIYRESPGYPLTLREAHIGGVVRLEITITARGSVEQITPVGGNPVLVEAASAAVRKWKYAPADTDTKTQVEFTFDPRH